MECPPFANFLLILINIHKPVPVLIVFGPTGDAMIGISLLVRLYRKMYMVRVKR